MIHRRRVPNIVISPLSNVTVEEVLGYDHVVKTVINETPKAIEHALDQKKDSATIIEINNSGNFIEINNKWWVNALQKCLANQEEKQNFEKCREISLLMRRVSQEKVPTINKLKNKKANPKK